MNKIATFEHEGKEYFIFYCKTENIYVVENDKFLSLGYDNFQDCMSLINAIKNSIF